MRDRRNIKIILIVLLLSTLSLAVVVVVTPVEKWPNQIDFTKWKLTDEPIGELDHQKRSGRASSTLPAEEVVKSITVTQNGWELVWRDEFHGVKLDESKWTKEDWAANKNEELEYYRPENVAVERGNLLLISKEESYKGRDYTSGAVHTKDKLDIRYGKIEMRAKLPAGQGVFPAFWMMTNKEDTWLPEIDIVEMLGHKPNEIWMVQHWLDQKNRLKSVSDQHVGVNYAAGFHTYGIEWTEESVAWFIDGVERFRTQAYIPSEPMYVYINTAVGGIWPGSPDETTVFPTYYEVDYVRVYTKAEGE